MVNLLICGIPLAQMVVGIVYWDQCPLSSNIPLYMVLNGVGWFLLGLRIWAPNWVDQHSWFGNFLGWVCGLAILFVIGWFLGGSYWVFKEFRRVEYTPTENRPEPMVKVEPYDDIDGPFTNNTFLVTTKQGTRNQTLVINWNGKEREQLKITDKHIDLCDKIFSYRGNGTTQAGEWSIFFNFTVVEIGFNGHTLVKSTKERLETCYFWERKVDKIRAGHAAVTVRFKDKALNEIYFENDPYCNKALYLFAFIVLIIVYAIAGSTATVAVCLG